VPDLVQGQIVLVEVLDPQGRNPKIRPLIIINNPKEIVIGVAVTSKVPTPLEPSHVELPYDTQGKVKTKLTKKSIAECKWLVEFQAESVVEVKGFVPNRILLEILEKVKNI